MRLPDWLLGQDSEDLRGARRVRTLLWWTGWFELAIGVGAIVFGLSQSHGVEQSSFMVPFLAGCILPFAAWAILSVLIEICDRLSDEVGEANDGDDVSANANV